MDLLKVGVVLLPDDHMDHLLREKSQFEGNLIPFSKSGAPYPHLSLFHLMVTERGRKGLSSVVHRVGLVSERMRPEFTCHEIVQKNGWSFLEVFPSEQLEHLQMLVILMSEVYREGRKIDISWEMTEEQREAHRIWGYPNVGKGWNPHFTLGKKKDKARGLIFRSDVDYRWRAKYLALVGLGEHGEAINVYNYWGLQK